MKDLKLQSAIEYLMTYSWALLIISIVIIAFVYLAVFTPSSYAGNYCVMQQGISCIQFTMNTLGILQINLQDAMQDPINVTAIGCNSNQTFNNMLVIAVNVIKINPGSNKTFTLQCYSGASAFSGPIGSIFTGSIILNYTDTYSSFKNTAFGRISAKVSKK